MMGAVRIEAFELLRVRLPLVRPFRTSFGTETVREALLVRARISFRQAYEHGESSDG